MGILQTNKWLKKVFVVLCICELYKSFSLESLLLRDKSVDCCIFLGNDNLLPLITTLLVAFFFCFCLVRGGEIHYYLAYYFETSSLCALSFYIIMDEVIKDWKKLWQVRRGTDLEAKEINILFFVLCHTNFNWALTSVNKIFSYRTNRRSSWLSTLCEIACFIWSCIGCWTSGGKSGH